MPQDTTATITENNTATPAAAAGSTRRRRSPAASAPTVQLSSDWYYPPARIPESEAVQDHAGRWIRASEQIVRQGRVFHPHDGNLVTCNVCSHQDLPSAFTSRGIISPSGTNGRLCGPCASRTWLCYSCHTPVTSTVNPRYTEDDEDHDRPLCPICFRRTAEIFGRLLPYSNKDIGRVPPKDSSSMLFGWEVEVHVRNNRDIQDIIHELHRQVGGGYYVTKSDGSLINGFEIVTRPDSMETHRKEWLRIFEAIAGSELLREHLRSCDSPRQCCGIHCHIDKSMLSQLHLGKLNVWLNHPNNRSFIEKIAGRGSNSYTSFKDDVRISDGRTLKMGTSPERYVALNVGQNTAEMRIFRGTLQPKNFFKNLDFVEASVEWTGAANCSSRAVADAKEFIRYVLDQQSRFPHLIEKLCEWDMIPTSKPKAKSAGVMRFQAKGK